jgi:hypothetical protein
MGKIGDPVFIRQLTALAKDETRRVRGVALRSLIAIRRAEQTKPAQAPLEECTVPGPVEESAAEAFVQGGPIFELPPDFDVRLDGSSFAAGRGRAARFGR